MFVPRLVDQGRRGHRARDRTGAGRPARTPPRWRGGSARARSAARCSREPDRRQDRLMTIRVLIVEDEADRGAGPQDVRRAHARVRGRARRRVVPGGRAAAGRASRSTWCCSTCTCPTVSGLDLLRQLRATGLAVRRHRRDVGTRSSTSCASRCRRASSPICSSRSRSRCSRPSCASTPRSGARSKAGDESIDQRGGRRGVRRAAAGAGGTSGCPRGSAARRSRPYARHSCRPQSGLTAGEVAELIGSSRVTARRYLEHLADLGQSTAEPRYGGTGRPHVEYVVRPSDA